MVSKPYYKDEDTKSRVYGVGAVRYNLDQIPSLYVYSIVTSC